MSTPDIEEFLIDNENEEKFWVHGLTGRQVVEVLDGVHIIVRNRRRRRASHLVVGFDHGGQCITVPVEPTHEMGLWRPVTAWPSKAVEIAALNRAKRNG